MLMISMNSFVTQDSEPIATRLDDEVAMLSVRAGAYFGLNRVGSEIWDMLAEPRRIDDVCAVLIERFEVPPDTLRREVSAFIKAMVDRRLLRLVDADEAAR
jgi:hypothetical protein